ncbi:hypothetical protein QWY85_12540 [Neolewinella lacunae]|uniref:Uncharacterized protein n=1 Tax=Neolewinella lacunae TaxID=1517758 RepID=A0A923PM15_9BACT|nr:hypothetical protein [Neolewinella lacunae]MBC6995196.1 hypothetical protein [Neolewinella lacunae]MDN3635493.1 hypothetical protein [Neolewinella lacunae]
MDKVTLILDDFIKPIERLHSKDCKINKYNLYYDETNNFRKFWIKNGRLNEEKYNTFVLGGVGFDGDDNNPNLFDKIDLKPGEIKFKTLAKGNFQDILKSSRLNIFLDSLVNSNYFVHFSAVDVMYYSLVDIVDSLIFQGEVSGRYTPYVFELKSFFYECLMEHRSRLHGILVKYGYPDINLEKSRPCLREIQALIKNDGSLMSQIIHSLIEMAIREESFTLLQDEDENILLSDFHQFYLGVIYNNIESVHCMDEEATIQSILDEYELVYNGNILTKVHFLNSLADRRIQYSDIWVGVMSRYFDFVKMHDIPEMEAIFAGFNKFQKQAFNNINTIINRSHEKDKFLLHQVIPTYILRRRDWMLEARLK